MFHYLALVILVLLPSRAEKFWTEAQCFQPTISKSEVRYKILPLTKSKWHLALGAIAKWDTEPLPILIKLTYVDVMLMANPHICNGGFNRV